MTTSFFVGNTSMSFLRGVRMLKVDGENRKERMATFWVPERHSDRLSPTIVHDL